MRILFILFLAANPLLAQQATKEDLKNLASQLELKIEKGDLAIEKQLREKPNLRNWVFWFAGANLLALLGLLKLVQDKIETKISTIVKRNKTTIRELIDEAKQARDLRKTKKILVLGKEREGEVVNRLEQLAFEEVYGEEWKEEESEDLFTHYASEGFHMVLFDSLGAKAIDAWLARFPENVFLAYTTAGHLSTIDQSRMIYANSPMSLHARTMELAHYLELTMRT